MTGTKKASMSKGPMITTKQAMELLECSQTTISRYILGKKVYAEKQTDGSYLVSKNDCLRQKENPSRGGRPKGSDVTVINGPTKVTISADSYKKLMLISMKLNKSKDDVLEQIIDEEYVAKKAHNIF